MGTGYSQPPAAMGSTVSGVGGFGSAIGTVPAQNNSFSAGGAAAATAGSVSLSNSNDDLAGLNMAPSQVAGVGAMGAPIGSAAQAPKNFWGFQG